MLSIAYYGVNNGDDEHLPNTAVPLQPTDNIFSMPVSPHRAHLYLRFENMLYIRRAFPTYSATLSRTFMTFGAAKQTRHHGGGRGVCRTAGDKRALRA